MASLFLLISFLFSSLVAGDCLLGTIPKDASVYRKTCDLNKQSVYFCADGSSIGL